METEFIQWLRERVATDSRVEVGPGDDAAVLAASDSRLVVTCDLLADGVHFEVERHSPHEIGYKALAVNLSDLAAMAAEPVAGFVSVALPRARGMELAKHVFEGMLSLADRYQLTLAGGDTNTWDGPLVVNATLIGRVTPRGPLLRNAARPGDQLIVTGSFGGSLLGHHLKFEPRIREALALTEAYQVNAGMDCSDGLALDVSRLAAESQCGAVLDAASIPIAAAAVHLAGQSGRTPLDHALGDGEDFELVLAVPADDADRMLAEQPLKVKLTRIGEFVEQRGLWRQENDQRVEIEPRGYEHEASDDG